MNHFPVNQETVRIVRLENGFTIAMEHLPFLHSAALGVWIRTGSAGETAAESGLAHFLEHLFFKGTKTRNVRQIMEAVESKGGYINASTSREYTNLYVRMLSKHVSIGVEILADILKNSLFCDMEKERGVILEEIASIEDTPDDLSHDLLTEFHWPDHPLGRPIAGTLASVETMTREDVVRFYKRWYTPDNMVFSIAGNFDEETVLQQLTEEFGVWEKQAAPSFEPAPAFRGGLSTVERPVSQVHMNLAFPGVAAGDDDRFICSTMVNILGGGSTSRLFDRIREEEGLAYSIYAYHYNFLNTGMIGVYQAVAPQNHDHANDLVFQEIRRICEETVPEEELEMNREQIKGSLLMSLESPSTRASRIAKSLLQHGRVPSIEEVTARFDAVTREQVQAFAQRVFRKEQCAFLALGPEGVKAPKEIPLS